MADEILEGGARNSHVTWQTQPYPAQVWMYRQDAQTLCCQNQAAFAQVPSCSGTPVVKTLVEAVGPQHSVSCSHLWGKTPWPANDPGGGKGPGLVLRGGKHAASWYKYSSGRGLRKISVCKSVPSGALGERWTLDLQRHQLLTLFFCSRLNSHFSSQVLQPLSTLLHYMRRRKPHIPPSTPSLETCPGCLTQPWAGWSELGPLPCWALFQFCLFPRHLRFGQRLHPACGQEQAGAAASSPPRVAWGFASGTLALKGVLTEIAKSDTQRQKGHGFGGPP